MNKLHHDILAVELIGKRKIMLLFPLLIAMFFPSLFSASDSGSKAIAFPITYSYLKHDLDTKTAQWLVDKEAGNRVSASAIPCASSSVQIRFVEKIPLARTLSNPSPTKYVVHPQGSGQNCSQCLRRQCAREFLCCPQGWTPQFDASGCCARCCQGSNCGNYDCCSSG
jgi:hypothetical protein